MHADQGQWEVVQQQGNKIILPKILYQAMIYIRRPPLSQWASRGNQQLDQGRS